MLSPAGGTATSSTASKGRDEGRLRMPAAALRAITVRCAPTLPRPASNRPAARHGRTNLSCTISSANPAFPGTWRPKRPKRYKRLA